MAVIALLTADYQDLQLISDLNDNSRCEDRIYISSDYARTGIYSYNVYGYGDYIRIDFGSLTEVYVAFGVYLSIDSAGDGRSVFAFHDSANGEQISFDSTDGGNYLVARRGATEIGDAFSVPVGEWFHLQVRLKANNTSGILQVKKDGALIVDETNIDTVDTTNENIRYLYLAPASGNWWNRVYFDDVVINDTTGSYNNGWPGNLKLCVHLPNADGDNTDFSPSAGTDNYAMVDDNAPDDDTTYVASGTASHYDLYEVENTDYSAGFLAIQVVSKAKMDDTGGGTMALGIKAGTTEDWGDNNSLDSSYSVETSIWETNPDDSSAFETNDIDSLQIGQKVGA